MPESIAELQFGTAGNGILANRHYGRSKAVGGRGGLVFSPFFDRRILVVAKGMDYLHATSPPGVPVAFV